MILFDEFTRRGTSLFDRYGLDSSLMELPFPTDRWLPEERPDLPEGRVVLCGRDWLHRTLERTQGDPVRWTPPTVRDVPVKPVRPRLFVSHRRADRECAMRVAWLADQAGFDVWIDVLDPDLANSQSMSDEVAIATVIEMALLNATHVCAVLTANTEGSQWVPYEYGRVKDGVTMTSRAACCVAPGVDRKKVPAWAYVGARSGNEPGLKQWLNQEWQSSGCPLAAPTGDWPPSVREPQQLWRDCLPNPPGPHAPPQSA